MNGGGGGGGGRDKGRGKGKEGRRVYICMHDVSTQRY